ncbi:hypothetical protein FVQ98_06810 [Ottowia sp. GY511]|uniref:DUF2157 domain-containing protein n=1 Tax=Ottowia flava TaxID=2675430 RepID=A0ABW4KRD2_9BURK|nr:hypothetical protein [Ottowia sp. GY511]TXK31002.1 hypothetical protein FVQ98_06810 [Ottowia sp. GY511]
MPPAPNPPSASRIDVRTLSLAQLQLLAERGSRRARAELEGRMRAASPAPAPMGHGGPGRNERRAMNDGFVPAERSVAAGSAVLRTPAGPPADLPTLTERAHPSGSAPLTAHMAPPAAGAPGPAQLNEALQKQLELIAQQEGSASRASGPPRLLGMVMIAWGALLLVGGLISLTHGGGVYYLFCGLGSAAIGWLLMRCSRWAMVVHGVLLLIALGWAWRSSDASVGLALVQAAPVWIAALWMAIRPVREGLD